MPRPLLFFTGLASLLLAPFGAHGVNLAAITAAIIEAQPEIVRRQAERNRTEVAEKFTSRVRWGLERLEGPISDVDLLVQTIIVIVWIMLNVVAVNLRWDPYPFILLNLAFSTQAAYAAPLILLAQNRQEARDRVTQEQDRDAEPLRFLRRCAAGPVEAVDEVQRAGVAGDGANPPAVARASGRKTSLTGCWNPRQMP